MSPALARGAEPTTRQYWTDTLMKVARPVLTSLSEGRLRRDMPVEAHAGTKDRPQYTHLEAFGRLLCGMAPWLESDADGQTSRLARECLRRAVDPASPDFLNFDRGRQPVVDAAFLALALLRAPDALWKRLDRAVQANLIAALQSSRSILPGFNNWLLFSATIEAFLAKAGAPWDKMRVDYALRQHEEWYKGDGLYGDGPEFHWDYYNSFVIQPMLLAVTDAVGAEEKPWQTLRAGFLERAGRYAAIQERLVCADGSYPAIGRSLAYRCGAFQLLADLALRRLLPNSLHPAQVRCALTAVIRRTLDAPETFDSGGWLQIGICGHQPSVGETYISTGSLYLCAAAFLPLGLPATDPFWSAPDEPWTAQKVWSGKLVPIDHAL